MSDYSVHDEEGFAAVYETEGEVSIDKSVLRALLDLATGSADFASCFWDNEQVEIARKVATILGIPPVDVTPSNFKCQYDGHVSYKNTYTISGRTLTDNDYYTNRCKQCNKIVKEFTREG